MGFSRRRNGSVALNQSDSLENKPMMTMIATTAQARTTLKAAKMTSLLEVGVLLMMRCRQRGGVTSMRLQNYRAIDLWAGFGR